MRPRGGGGRGQEHGGTAWLLTCNCNLPCRLASAGWAWGPGTPGTTAAGNASSPSIPSTIYCRGRGQACITQPHLPFPQLRQEGLGVRPVHQIPRAERHSLLQRLGHLLPLHLSPHHVPAGVSDLPPPPAAARPACRHAARCAGQVNNI